MEQRLAEMLLWAERLLLRLPLHAKWHSLLLLLLDLPVHN
jgi:hypothetical protein